MKKGNYLVFWVIVIITICLIYGRTNPLPYKNRDECIAAINTQFGVDWADACRVTQTGLAAYLTTCDLPYAVSSVIENNRNQGINGCYTTYSK